MSLSDAKPLRIVLLGPPASGKGTQGRRLAEAFDLGYLSTGALLREQVETGSELGKQAEPILARGEYLPDDLMCPILADWVSRQSPDQGWVLDGFPRSLPQAVFLDELLGAQESGLDAAISLKVPFDDLLARIQNRVECPSCRWTGQKGQLKSGKCPSCGSPAGPRADDGEENFRNRHAEFVSLTQPVIEHYSRLGLLFPCDATAPQDETADRLIELLSAGNA